MKTQTVNRFETQLLEMRDRLRSDIQDRVDLVPEQLHTPGDVTNLPTHKADNDVEGLDVEVATGAVQSQLLADVEAALNRIENGTYGDCAGCGQPIAEERLEALPQAPYCVDCERDREME